MRKRDDITLEGVKALRDKGYSIAQITEVYHCSYSIIQDKVRELERKVPIKRPITPDEIEYVKETTRPGDPVKVMDYRKTLECGGVCHVGRLVKTRIAKKYRHLATLENGQSITYVELAMQRRTEDSGK